MFTLILSFLYKQNNVNLGVMDKIEHVKILLDSKNVYIGAKELNLTEDILKKVNKELK